MTFARLHAHAQSRMRILMCTQTITYKLEVYFMPFLLIKIPQNFRLDDLREFNTESTPLPIYTRQCDFDDIARMFPYIVDSSKVCTLHFVCSLFSPYFIFS